MAAPNKSCVYDTVCTSLPEFTKCRMLKMAARY